ncbi:MAG: hypothetical protein PHP98_01270 [Kiritimatiellae bacterium]|nr:hypothetical protein [Kiritimatiellia bacterium]
MREEFSKLIFWPATVAGAAGVIVLAWLTCQSMFRLCGAQPDHDNPLPAVETAPAARENINPDNTGRMFSPPPVDNEFCTDSALIRQREKERQEMKTGLPLTGDNASNVLAPGTGRQNKPADPCL